MSEDQMLADLALRNWQVNTNYLYRRIDNLTVVVCMYSKNSNGWSTCRLPHSRMEEARGGPNRAWEGGPIDLMGAREAALKYDAEHES